MRKNIILFVTLFSANIWACPTIQGKFSCTWESNNNTQEYEFETLIKNAVSIYRISQSNISDIELIADGVKRSKVETDGDTTQFTIQRTVCSEQIVSVEYTVKLVDSEGNELISSKIAKTFGFGQNNGLVLTYSDQIFGISSFARASCIRLN